MSKLKVINVGLELEATDKTNAALKQIESSFSRLNDSTKAMNFNGITADVEELRNAIIASAKAGEDTTKQVNAYTKAVSKSIAELDKQASDLKYQLSEQGKVDRARLAQLEAQKTLTKEEAKEQARLAKTVIKKTDDEIEAMIKRTREMRIALKLSREEVKSNGVARKTFAQLVKADLSALNERIKKQKEYIKTLFTTEGMYKNLKKAAGAGLKLGAKVAGGAAIGAVGMLGALVGGTVGAVDSNITKERAANRIKGRWSDTEREQLLNNVYIRTGADYGKIVDAINRVQTVLGKGAAIGEVESATASELKYPGSASLFQSNSSDKTRAWEIERLESRLHKIQRATGAGDDIIASAMQAAQASRLGGGRLSQTEYIALYSALKASNAFDSDEQITRALESFSRRLNKGDNAFEAFGKFNFAPFVQGQQNRNQLAKGLASVDLYDLRKAARSQGLGSMTASEKMAADLRKLQMQKDDLLVQLLPVLQPVIEKLRDLVNSGAFKTIINGMIDFFTIAASWFMRLVGFVEELYNGIKDSWFFTSSEEPTDISAAVSRSTLQTLPQKSMGGLALSPSLVGERGAELVLPLDYSRSGRTTNIINNFTQTFSMSGNQTTATSLATAIRDNGFIQTLVRGRV